MKLFGTCCKNAASDSGAMTCNFGPAFKLQQYQQDIKSQASKHEIVFLNL